MPEVPLTYPTTAPTQGGAAPINVNAPVEAFGGAVGAALSNLGQSVQADSDRIWERAVQIQDLQNRTETDNAVSDLTREVGLRHAAFTSKKGLNAGPEALEAHMKELDDLRQGIGAKLSNPAVRKLYETQSRRVVAQTIFNAAGHSGNEVSKAAISAGQDNADMNFGAGVTGANEPTAEMYRKQGLDAVRRTHDLTGISKEDRDIQEYEINSQFYSQRAQYLAENPEVGGLPAARAYIDAHKEEMKGHGGKDLENAEKVYKAQNRAAGTFNIANGVYAAHNVGGEQTQTMEEGEAEVRKKAEPFARGDDLFVQHAVGIYKGLWRDGISSQRYTQNQAKQTVMEIINAGAKTEAEIRAAPNGAQALKNLKESDKALVASWAYRAEETRDLFTKKKNFSRLWDMGKNATDVDTQARFMDADLNIEPLEETDRKSLISLRGQILKQGPKLDPRVPQAMTQLMNSQLGGTLAQLHLDRRTADNVDDFHAWRGSLGLALEQWQQDHGKPPNHKELIEQIAPVLLRNHTDPGMFNGFFHTTREVPDWKQAPEAFRRGELEQAAKTGQPPPSDDVIQAKYIRGLLNDYYKKSKSQERAPGAR